LRLLGLKEWSEGRPAAAIRFLEAATKFMPDIAALWSDLGGAYYAMNSLEEARTCTLISLDKDSAQPSAWLLLATIQSETQNDAEAETAFLEAVRLNPQLATAFAGLGLLYFRQRRFKESADRLESAIRQGNQVPLVNACLGQALYLLGNFQGAGDAFAIDASVHPQNAQIRKKLAFTRFVESMIHEDLESAVAMYHKIAGPYAEDIEGVTQKAFHLLSSYGHHDAAIKLGRARLALVPEDPIQSYLLAALMREPLSRAPKDYIINYFNKFAYSFDAQLVDVLGYTAPDDLHRLLMETHRTFPDVLDLGCGTGLAGPLLQSLAGTLTGVDLSRKMLEKAVERRVYDWLIEGEILRTLESQPDRFDLIFAADVLIYFGDLAQLMRCVAGALKPGGLFAFSIESASGAGYTLLPSGRFAHSPAYIEELARDHFIVVHEASKAFRLEAGAPVDGALYVLQRGLCAA